MSISGCSILSFSKPSSCRVGFQEFSSVYLLFKKKKKKNKIDKEKGGRVNIYSWCLGYKIST